MRNPLNSHTASYTILLTALFLIVSIAVITTPVMAGHDNDWETLETDHFNIEYQSGYEGDAQQIGRMAETARTELLAEIPADGPPTLKNPIHIRIYPEEQWDKPAYSQYWKSDRGDNKAVRIHLQAPSEAEDVTIDQYERALWAEYANIVLWDAGTEQAGYGYYDRTPLWFHEGFSDYYVFQSPSVRDSFPSYGMPSINESIRNGETSFEEVTQHEYAGGQLVSMYMVDRYGEDAVWRVHNSGEDFWSAVQLEFGVNKTTFVHEWQKWSVSHTRENDATEEQQKPSTPDSETIETDNGSTSQDTESEQTESETPGFGIGSGITAIGATGYVLIRRLRDDFN